MAEAISKEQFASLMAKNQTDSSVLKNLPDLITELKKLTNTLAAASLTPKPSAAVKAPAVTKTPTANKEAPANKENVKGPSPVTISDISALSYKKLESLFKIVRKLKLLKIYCFKLF
jgi:hypothetical protein